MVWQLGHALFRLSCCERLEWLACAARSSGDEGLVGEDFLA